MSGDGRIFRIAMRVLLGAAFLLAAAQWGRAQEANSDPSILRIPGEHRQFHVGNDPRCASAEDAGCTWNPQLPRYLDPTESIWLRYQVTLTETLRSLPQLGLLIQGQVGLYEVYVNGHLIGGTSGTSPWHASADTRGIFRFPSSFAPDGRLTLVIRTPPRLGALGGAGLAGVGPRLPNVLAPADRIQTVADAETLAYLPASIPRIAFASRRSGFAALVFLLLFSVNTRLRENLWLGGSLGATALLRVGEISRMVSFGMPLWLSSLISWVGNTVIAWLIIEFVFA